VDHLPNFYRVSARLFRGGRPTREGMAGLEQLGIRTIVDLRDRSGISSVERKQARAHGIRYHRIPLGTLLGPARATMDRVLRILADPESGPVYVHCRRGCDRTGAVIACHRIANEGWTAEEAIAEARERGMIKIEFLKRVFIRRFYRALTSKSR
jgi:tyrosine-protein phosphatase SIW14